MLRDRRLRHLEDLDESVHVELPLVAVGELLDDTNPTFMTESAKELRKLSSDHNSCWHSYIQVRRH
jgi:hypothetical protein